VHVPFCPTICPFCDFHVLERRRGAVDAYLRRLDREAAETSERLEFQPGGLRTIYLGGGTPSHLRDDELARLVEILRRRLGWASRECTLEVHPSTVRPGRVERWRDLGFTRLSVGLQSTDDAVLRFLGRPHDAATGLAALERARRADGLEVSADLITAVPGQDVESDLRAVAARGVDHLSAYTLTIEPGTPFARDGVEVDAHAEADSLRLAGEVLGEYGLLRYEVSNHARPGAESDHNLGYWRNEWYLGLGPSASAYEPRGRDDATGDVVYAAGNRGNTAGALRGWRRTNPTFDRWLAGEAAEPEPVTARDVVVEGLLVGLRLREGVDLARLSGQAGLDVDDVVGEALQRLQRQGRIERDGRRLWATATGMAVLDQVVAEIL
jgi:oxygen-independent coproporphyrinogen-3 oxidase